MSTISRRAGGAVLAGAALCLPLAVGSASAAPPADCTGTMTGALGSLDVPDGATCTLTGASVSGNIKIGTGSSLMTTGSYVRLNVMGDRAKTVLLIDTQVDGQIHLTRTSGQITIGTAGCKTDPIADGNINLQDNYGPIAICQMTIKNNIILHKNHNRIGVFDNRVGNNIQVIGNTSRAIRLRDNVMDNNLLLKGNTVAVAFVVLRNTMGVNANCTGNAIAPSGSGNVAGGSLSGQCTGLG